MDNTIDFDNLDRPILLQFYADWCAPCRTQTGVVNHIKADIEEYVDLRMVNLDKDREWVEEFYVRSVPTLILLNKQGDIYWRQSGVTPPQLIVKHVVEVSELKTIR
ncbi:thioredoxin family protein [Myroides pelagicus]|uniref:thioredoxin family protein n=1 Tax=Myroides pelagicus TaxID=270914 RepID=UPI002DBE555A|nr:thioredoxin family protein [Myroides pelagicus]MEC4114815.1 thioredoxin family protein [Myroides pelagicus]